MELAHKRNIHVALKGTVVDKRFEVLADDYDEWLCLEDVTMSVHPYVSTQVDRFGNFSIDKNWDKSNVREIKLHFSNNTHNPKTVMVPIIDEAEHNEMLLVVVMEV